MPISRHVSLLAVLHAAFTFLTLVPVMLITAVMGGMTHLMTSLGLEAAQRTHGGEPELERVLGMVSTTMHGILAVVFVLTLVFAIPHLFAAWGLYKRKEWGRILTLILSFLQLLNIPFGTMLGVYGLWALLSDEGQAYFAEGDVHVPSPSPGL